MHEELFVIRDLNRIDMDIQHARAELAGMIAAVRTSTDSVVAQKVVLGESEAALLAARLQAMEAERDATETLRKRARGDTQSLADLPLGSSSAPAPAAGIGSLLAIFVAIFS